MRSRAAPILGDTTAHGDEQTQGPSLRLLLGERHGGGGLRPKDTKRERVGEHEAVLKDLVRRPVSRRAERGHAWLSLLHGR